MAFRYPFVDLQDLVGQLARAGQLRRVSVPVDPYLEVTEIVQRTLRTSGPALLFERPTQGDMPLLINVFGTDERMAAALGVGRFDEVGDRIARLIRPELPAGLSGMREALGKLTDLRGVPPKRVRSAPCQEVVYKGADVDLNRLPAVHAWPEDGGAFLNFGLTHTAHPETGQRNLGMYRLQRHDSRTVGMHWQIHKDSTAHHAVAERRGERLPVAIAFGCDPAVTLAACTPLPSEIDEYLFAGFVRRERIELVDCLTVPLRVPANAQVVLEGWLEPGVRRPEGPFGDHTGFYTPVEPFPALTVECMTMRRDPIFQTVVCGPPPQEDAPMGRAVNRIMLPLVRMIIPEIVDMELPAEGVFHNCAIVSIDKRYPKQAHKVMSAIWGAHLLSLTKLIVVVDADCDVRDYREVAWRAFGNVDYAHDMLQTVGPVDHLDHASYQQFWGGKLGVDATRKLPEEGYTRGWPRECRMTPEVAARVSDRWREYGL